MRKISTVLLIAHIFFPIALAASPPEPILPQQLTLKEAIFLALRFSPDVQNEEIQRVVDKFALRVTQNAYEMQYALTGSFNQAALRTSGQSQSIRSGNLVPAAYLQGDYGTEYNVQVANTMTNGVYNPGINVAITQPLFRGFGKEVTLAPLYIAEINELLSQLGLKRVLMQTVLNVIDSYNNLVRSQNSVSISKLSLENYQTTIGLDNALIKAGRKAPTEVLKAKAEYASREVDLQNNENAVLTDQLNLMNVIGLSPDVFFSIVNDISEIQFETLNVEECYAIAERNNIDFQVAKWRLKIDERNLVVQEDNARVQFNVSLLASTGNGVGDRPNSGLQSLTNNKNTAVGVELSLDVPINNYLLKQAIVDARAMVDKDKIDIAAITRTLKSNIIRDINNVMSEQKQIELAKNALDLQQQNQDQMLAKLKFGLVSTFDVTTNQQALDNARSTLIQRKIAYLNATARLYYNMGVLLEKWNIQLKEVPQA